MKRVDCALLPPCRRTLQMKIRRAQYVSAIWTRATEAYPADGISPTDYGWYVKDGTLVPSWFECPAIPDKLFASDIEALEVDSNGEDMDEEIVDEQVNTSDMSDDEPWSEDSDSDEEDFEETI